MAWTLAIVTSRATDDVIRAYGGDPPGPPTALPCAQARRRLSTSWTPNSLIQLRKEGQRVDLMENNG